MKEFRYSPSRWVPFRDVNVLDRVRRITREEIDRHPANIEPRWDFAY